MFEFTAITPLYAGLFGLLYVYLSRRLVILRNQHGGKMQERDHTEMTAAVRAHTNIVEYVPIALLMMLLVEIQDTSRWIVHALGLLLVLARILHLIGIHEPSGASPRRKVATKLTWLQIAAASALSLLASIGISF